MSFCQHQVCKGNLCEQDFSLLNLFEPKSTYCHQNRSTGPLWVGQISLQFACISPERISKQLAASRDNQQQLKTFHMTQDHRLQSLCRNSTFNPLNPSVDKHFDFRYCLMDSPLIYFFWWFWVNYFLYRHLIISPAHPKVIIGKLKYVCMTNKIYFHWVTLKSLEMACEICFYEDKGLPNNLLIGASLLREINLTAIKCKAYIYNYFY